MIVYSVNEGDYMAFQEHHYKTSPAARKALARARYGVPVLYVALGAIGFAVGERGLLVVFGVLAILWLLLYPAYYHRTMRRRVLTLIREGDNSNVYGQHELSIEGDELVGKRPNGTSRLRLSAIHRIDSTEGYLFVYVSGLAAMIIPRSKASGGDLAAFERELRAGLQAGSSSMR